MDASVAETLKPPRPSLAIGQREFSKWLEKAEPGARIEYHRGHLAIDRADRFSRFTTRQRAALDAVADHAAALAAEGRLLLVQERHGEGDSSYFAVKAKRPGRWGER